MPWDTVFLADSRPRSELCPGVIVALEAISVARFRLWAAEAANRDMEQLMWL
jgi:hypothetical protein